MCYNSEYGSEDILADTFFDFSFLWFFHSDQLFELKSSIASIITETKDLWGIFRILSNTTNNFFAATVNQLSASIALI